MKMKHTDMAMDKKAIKTAVGKHEVSQSAVFTARRRQSKSE